MSHVLLTVATTFLNTKSDPELFVEEFISQWKKERDNGVSLSDTPQLSEALSSIFCLADMFNPDGDRESYELDEVRLRSEIEKVLEQASLL